MADWLAVRGDDLVLYVRLSPSASKDRIGAPFEDDAGQQRLKISVTAVPENGKANKALIKLLSKKLKLAKSSVEVVSGHTDRNKRLSLPACADRLAEFQNILGS
ncbi:MAG: DUF167 family protein [Alphaproteobacteria bacterium]